MISVKPLSPFWVDGDKGERYQCRPLSGLEALELMPEISNENDIIKVTGRALRLAVMHGVTGWEGREDQFSSAAINNLPPVTLHNLADEIINATNWTGE